MWVIWLVILAAVSFFTVRAVQIYKDSQEISGPPAIMIIKDQVVYKTSESKIIGRYDLYFCGIDYIVFVLKTKKGNYFLAHVYKDFFVNKLSYNNWTLIPMREEDLKKELENRCQLKILEKEFPGYLTIA